MDGNDMGQLMAEFLEFKAQRDAQAAQDNDPDNDRDVAFTAPDGSTITLPWRKAREFDIESLLGSKFGLKRKAAPAAAQGGDDDGSDGKQGKGGKAGQAPAAGGAAAVANIFRTKPASGKAS